MFIICIFIILYVYCKHCLQFPFNKTIFVASEVIYAHVQKYKCVRLILNSCIIVKQTCILSLDWSILFMMIKLWCLAFLPGQWWSPACWATGSLVPWPSTLPVQPCDSPPHPPPVPPLSEPPRCTVDVHRSGTPLPVCYWPHSCLSYNRRDKTSEGDGTFKSVAHL